MSSRIQYLEQKKLIKPPRWLSTNVHYETMMGSVAYGVSGDTSDTDIYGFCIPTKELVFPHLAGDIPGFGRQKERFEQYQEHHIMDADAAAGKGKEYDVQIFSIVKYFQLAMENNPNMIDSLFTPQFCVLHITKIGSMVRENRKMFLHKGAFHKFRGYAHSQLHKMSEATREKVREFEAEYEIPSTNYLGQRFEEIADFLGRRHEINPFIADLSPIFATLEKTFITSEDQKKGVTALHRYQKLVKDGDAHPVGGRKEIVEKFGFDVKFAYHVLRLSDECEQILEHGDIDLQRSRELLKSIRRGEISEKDIRMMFSEKEKYLEKLYSESKLPHSPDEDKIKTLLLSCLEEHYGSLDKCIVQPDQAVNALRQIQDVLDRNKNVLN